MSLRTQKRCTSLLAVVGVILVGCSEKAEPNVILVSLDTLRADRMGVYGYHRNTTPHLEALADQGVVFENFYYNGGGTLPSHMSMMTSLYPHVHRVLDKEKTLEEERVTLAEVFKDAGYATAGFADAGWMKGKFGFDQGFEIYDDVGGRFEKILPKAFAWIREHRDQKFFLFLHTYDTHSESGELPYSCPGGYASQYTSDFQVDFDGCIDDKCASRLLKSINDEVKAGQAQVADFFSPADVEYISALYDGCINYVDDRVAELTELLKKLKIFDQTLIVITSDHGEEFSEHGYFLHSQGGHEEVAHIPLIVKFPYQEYSGVRVEWLGAMVDLMPTILDILDLEVPSDAQGITLLPAVTDGSATREDVKMVGVFRTNNWKFFERDQRLFDMNADRGEKRNIFSSEPNVVASLRERLDELYREHKRAIEIFEESRVSSDENEAVPLTADEIKQLKALGYL